MMATNRAFISPPAPLHFDEIFVSKGRLECEAYFHVPRITVDAWLRERGKQRLIDERAAVVRQQQDAKREGLSRHEMEQILHEAFPAHADVDPVIARHAAQHLRMMRNGGWIISPTKDGDWRVGTRRRSAFELVELAKAKGFDPASLTGRGG